MVVRLGSCETLADFGLGRGDTSSVGRSSCIVVVVAVALAAVVGGQVPAEARSAAGRIVFASSRDGFLDVFVVNADGSGLTKLTRGVGHEYAPAPSPGGVWIAYRDDARDRLMLIDSRGRARRPLPCAFAASWSPKGQLLACAVIGLRDWVRGGSSGGGVGVVDVRSGTLRRLSPEGGSPAWSPDGRRVAFVGSDGEGVFVVSSSGGRSRKLTAAALSGSSTGWGDELSWSGDGRTIAFVRRDAVLAAVDVATGRTRAIARHADPGAPSFSADGSRLAYTARVGRGSGARTEVFVVGRDGAGARAVTRGRRGESSKSPRWLPDGRLIYERERFPGGGLTDLWLVRPDGKGARPLVAAYATGESAGGARWLPGPPLRAGDALPAAVLRPARVVGWRSLARHLDAGSDRATWAEGCQVSVWAAQRREVARFAGTCSDESESVVAVAVGETHVLWLQLEEHNALYQTLVLADLGTRKRVVLGTPTFDGSDGSGAEIDNLVGDGTIFAFNTSQGSESAQRQVWLAPARGGRATCPGGSARACVHGGAGRVLAAGGGRVAVAVGSGIALYDEDGRRERTLAFPRTSAIEAALSHDRLVARSNDRLTVIDLTTEERRTFPLIANAGAALLDVEDEFVLYRAAGAIQALDLATGKTRSLELAGAAPPLSARLEPSGLYYLYNSANQRRPGRVAFVPLADMRAAVRA